GLGRGVMVPIQPEGSRLPLFCVHGIGGAVLSYAHLARHLPDDQPFYGLQARGIDGLDRPHTKVEDMAADYLRAIRAVQPRGPDRGANAAPQTRQQALADAVSDRRSARSAGLAGIPGRQTGRLSGCGPIRPGAILGPGGPVSGGAASGLDLWRPGAWLGQAGR